MHPLFLRPSYDIVMQFVYCLGRVFIYNTVVRYLKFNGCSELLTSAMVNVALISATIAYGCTISSLQLK